jgi:hypothetical protein
MDKFYCLAMEPVNNDASADDRLNVVYRASDVDVEIARLQAGSKSHFDQAMANGVQISLLKDELESMKCALGAARKEKDDWVQVGRDLISERDAAQAQVAELRKPVTLQANATVEGIRADRLNQPYAKISLLLSAYDTLAQDCARYANAHGVVLTEMRGLRARLQTDEQRERQLREAIAQALQLRDSAWLAVDSRKTALNNLAAALAASPAPMLWSR